MYLYLVCRNEHVFLPSASNNNKCRNVAPTGEERYNVLRTKRFTGVHLGVSEAEKPSRQEMLDVIDGGRR